MGITRAIDAAFVDDGNSVCNRRGKTECECGDRSSLFFLARERSRAHEENGGALPHSFGHFRRGRKRGTESALFGTELPRFLRVNLAKLNYDDALKMLNRSLTV